MTTTPRREGGRTLIETAPDQLRWIVSVRESTDRTKQISNQLSDMRSFVRETGGTVVREVPENRVSAFKRRPYTLPDGTTGYRVIRPEFEQILTDLRRGVANALAVPDIDRLTRDPRTLEDLIDLVEHYGVLIVSRTGNIDLTTDSGISSARHQVSQRNDESRNTSRRVSDGVRHSALEGNLAGSRYRPFGWRKDRIHINKREAWHIREAVKKIMAGASIHTIALDWLNRGIPTVSGAPWRDATVRDIMLNPRLCGIRTYHGEILTDSDGNPVRGVWDAILTDEQHAAVVAAWGPTDEPGSRLTGRGRGYHTTYLLSPFLRCGVCNARMVGHRYRSKNGEIKTAYQCPAPGNGGCGKVSRATKPVDDYVKELVILDQQRVKAYAKQQDRPWPNKKQLDEVRRQIKVATDNWRAGKISDSRYFALLESLERDEKKLVKEEQEHSAHRQSQRHVVANLAEEWDKEEFTIERKQAAIAKSLRAVIIKPSGRRPFHPDQIIPVWTESHSA